jgi:perosamine synthetase
MTHPFPLAVAGTFSPRQVAALRDALNRATVDPSLLSDLEGAGPVAALEEAFAQSCHTRYALAVSSGTAALHAALLAVGVGPGDEVVVSPYSWPQSVSPVVFCGAKPVFADIDPDTWNLDPTVVSRMLTPRTRAIVPVHLFGQPADMTALTDIGRKRGIPVIADAAQALGAEYKGSPIGKWGDAACFSLGRGKLVSGGEGGILVTDDEDLYRQAVRFSQHPERVRRCYGVSYNISLALNYRIHSMGAVLALADMQDMPRRLRHRRAIFQAVCEALAGCNETFKFQAAHEGAVAAAYGVPLSFLPASGRRELTARLQSEGVPLRCGPVGKPLYRLVQERHSGIGQGRCASCLPVVEHRCGKLELWLLSALDMDAISPAEAARMGTRIAGAISEGK